MHMRVAAAAAVCVRLSKHVNISRHVRLFDVLIALDAGKFRIRFEMISCTIHGNNFIVGLNKKVVFINLENHEVLREFTIPDKIEAIQGNHEENCEEGSKKQEAKQKIPVKIQDIALSPNGEHFIVTTSGQKGLITYRLLSNGIVLLSQRSISRTTSAMTFSPDSLKLLTTDKAGDCFIYDCLDPQVPGRWLLGHLSMILDVLFAPSEEYIITCDRDEKVRVTQYPDCHEIESYCLGHLEYVSEIEFLPQNPSKYLASLSGDNTIRIWEYVSGKQKHEIQLPAPGVKFSIQQVDPNTCHIAAIVYRPNESIYIYKVTLKNDQFSSTLVTKKAYTSEIMTNICFSHNRLYCTAILDGRLRIEILKYDNESYVEESNDRLQAVLDKCFPEDKVNDVEDISGWFKKKFDNVSEYLERKRKRLEEKGKPKQGS